MAVRLTAGVQWIYTYIYQTCVREYEDERGNVLVSKLKRFRSLLWKFLVCELIRKSSGFPVH
jgi:hypothetical protein